MFSTKHFNWKFWNVIVPVSFQLKFSLIFKTQIFRMLKFCFFLFSFLATKSNRRNHVAGRGRGPPLSLYPPPQLFKPSPSSVKQQGAKARIKLPLPLFQSYRCLETLEWKKTTKEKREWVWVGQEEHSHHSLDCIQWPKRWCGEQKSSILIIFFHFQFKNWIKMKFPTQKLCSFPSFPGNFF